MNTAFFLAEVRDKRIVFKNDEYLREMLTDFDGAEIEILIRKKSGDKYGFLEKSVKRIFQEFMTDFDEGEAAAMLTWSGSGYDSIEIIRRLAQRRFDEGKPVPSEIISFFSLGGAPMLFAPSDEHSRKSISEAVSA